MEPLSYRDALLEVDSTVPRKEPSTFFLPPNLFSSSSTSSDDPPNSERQRRVEDFVEDQQQYVGGKTYLGIGQNGVEHFAEGQYPYVAGRTSLGEEQRRVEDFVEDQHQYVAERTSLGKYYIDPTTLPTEPSNYGPMLWQRTPTNHFHPSYRVENPSNEASGGTDRVGYTNWMPWNTETSWTSWQSRDYLSEMLAMKRTGIAGPSTSLKLRVFPEFPVNFSMNNIRFHIEVDHVPPQLLVTCLMLDACIFSPSGDLLRCYIQNDPFGVRNSFNGFVRVAEAVGYYKLRVRLTLPSANEGPRNTICETIHICVSKNYLHNSREGFSFQGQFKPMLHCSNYYGQHVPSKVWGLTCNHWRNHIYYADRHSNQINCVDAEGRAISSFGKTLGLNRPTGLAFDHGLNRLVVTDKNNHRIAMLTPEGQFLSAFGGLGDSHGQFHHPWDVAVNPINQNVAVADSRNKRVQLFDRQYNFIGKYSDFEADPTNHNKEFQLDCPRSVCFDGDGRFLYSSDFSTNKLLKLRSNVSVCRKAIFYDKEELRRPQGILLDRHENILVADSRNNSIRLLSDEGKMISTFREVSNHNMQYPVNLTFLAGEEKLVALDGDARIYVI